jgi:D-3-phosphoglycerate dehydrogenase
MTLPVIVVAEGALAQAARVVEHFSGQIELRFADVSTPEAVGLATVEASGIVVALQPLRGEHVTALGPGVKVIGRAGVGLDSIDLRAAETAGIAVINEPAYGANEVASHAVAMILALQRNLLTADRYVRDGWSGALGLGRVEPVDEITVGLIGCGRIGSAMAAMLQCLVREVVVYDPMAERLPSHVRHVPTLEALLSESDVVSLHVPLTPETQGLVDEAFLATMKPGAMLINVSRGPVIDEKALVEALESGHIGGAALDVFTTEPLPSDSPLLSAPHTLFSPHMAAYSERSAWRLGAWTVGDSLSWIVSKSVQHGNIVVRGTR